MDGTWETLTFGQDGESVGEVGHVVLMRYILGLDWRVSLQKNSRLGVSKMKRLTLSGSVGSNLATP
jgi:hypothetical protein